MEEQKSADEDKESSERSIQLVVFDMSSKFLTHFMIVYIHGKINVF